MPNILEWQDKNPKSSTVNLGSDSPYREYMNNSSSGKIIG